MGIDASLLSDADARSEPVRAQAGAPGRLFGREHELRTALGLLAGRGPRALILAGEPGIGKTSIWREILREARDRDFEVLGAMPSGAEVQLTFAALGDLVDGLGECALARLAPPQRRALDVALLRAEGPTVDPRAVGMALLELLRTCAAERPLLIGIDDLQWLDDPSARALEFALRRLDGAPVAVAATLRTGERGGAPALALAAVLGPERVEQLDIGPLTLAAIHELVVARLHAEPPRRTLVSLFEAAGGNPFVAGEVAGELARRGLGSGPGGPLPVPPSVRQLVAARVQRLAPEVRELLLAAGGLARPTVELLARLRPDAEDTLRPAADAGVIEPGFQRGEVRFTHPLHARVPYEALEPAARRRLHARLARVVDDVEERARHAALAATRPSAEVAATLDRAADTAGARGALARAAELCTLAARLTPAQDGQAGALRTLAAAQWLHRAGETERGAELAEGLLAAPDADGDTRARAMSVLAAVRSDTTGVPAALVLYERARREPAASMQTRAEVHRRIAWLWLGSGRTAGASRHARASLRLAAGRERRVEAGAAAIASLASVMGGGGLDEGLLARTELPSACLPAAIDQWAETAPEVLAALTLLWAGELERARPAIEDALRTATERDESALVMHALAYLSAIATGLGELEPGLAHARRYLELAAEVDQEAQRGAALWPVAAASAWLGDEPGARAAAREGLRIARDSGYGLYEIGCLAALGLLELSLERPAAAAEALTRARALAEACGVRALGRLPLLPDSIEALAALDDVDGAAALHGELTRRTGRLGTPWALALAYRSEGLIAEARGEADLAITAYGRALAEHGRQDRPGERARTELVLGRVLRRARQKRAAREALGRAVSGFEAIGAELWAAQARRELARIGGRAASAAGRLSATEGSIAELVAAGRTNQEVAVALHLSARTVEWNLSKVYRKLGLRGRTELAAAVAAGELRAGAVAGEPGAAAPGAAVKPGGSPG